MLWPVRPVAPAISTRGRSFAMMCEMSVRVDGECVILQRSAYTAMRSYILSVGGFPQSVHRDMMKQETIQSNFLTKTGLLWPVTAECATGAQAAQVLHNRG